MEPLPMILPKGIVLNIDRVYKEVASYPLVPPEKIYEYWHVYTTTQRKLKDPTASRLENFWWHIMGSDRRLLSGPTLARLFEHISNGPTFVRLRGPANRYEGPSTPNALQDLEPSLEVSVEGSTSKNDGSPRPIQSSSSKPPPSHPILKKPRGPSSSGPRPTARFVSPAESDADEDKKGSEVDSSVSTTGTVNPGRKSVPPSTNKEKQKKSGSVTSKKKVPTFVASTSSKRRPTMPRRQSSQSSATGSEAGSRDERSSLNSKYLGSHRPISPIAERPTGVNRSKSHEGTEQMSAKLAGKQAATKTAIVQSESLRERVSRAEAASESPPTMHKEPKSPQAKKLSGGKGNEHVKGPKVEGNTTHAASSHGRNDTQERARPRADMDSPQPAPREAKQSRRITPHGLLSSSTATTSTVAAHGTIIEFDQNLPSRDTARRLGGMEDDLDQGLPRSDSTVTLTPTVPSNAPTVPLGRSKSQLTLLLERQGDKKARH